MRSGYDGVGIKHRGTLLQSSNKIDARVCVSGAAAIVACDLSYTPQGQGP